MGMRRIGLVLLAVVALGAACVPPTTGARSVQYDIDGHCKIEIQKGGNSAGSWVTARKFGVLQGPGPFEGCFHWQVHYSMLETTDDTYVCDWSTINPANEPNCTTYAGPLSGNGPGFDWHQVQGPGAFTSGLMIAMNQVTDSTVQFTLP